MKDLEAQEQQNQFRGAIPSAPPTYDEVMHGASVIAPQNVNPQVPYPVQHSVYPNAPGIMPPSVGTYTQSPTVIEVQRTVIAALGPSPAHITCPNCNYVIVTLTETEPNCAAHLCCLFLLVIGCCPFSSLPYCMDSLKNVRHYCPNCKVFLGSYQP